MALFWVLATIMVVIALGFVLLPFLKRGSPQSVDQDELNIAVIKQELAELDTDLEIGKLDPAEYEAARKDLAKELLYDVSEPDGQSSRDASASSGRWAAGIFVVGIPLAAVLLYQHLGSSQLIPILQSQGGPGGSTTTQDGSQQPSLDVMVAKLAERLRQQPDDPEGWQMLGRTYVILERYDEAAEAYENLNRLTEGKDPTVLANYAETLALIHGGKLAGKPAELIQTALTLQPRNPKALWLNGYVLFQQEDFSGAIRQWTQLTELYPEGSDEITQIEENIKQARQRMGMAAETQAQPPEVDTKATASKDDSSASPAARAIRTQVTLAGKLIDRASPDDTVFIFARAMDGPRMPLAIVRKQVKDLPITIRLDDSLAMSPAMVLSGFDEVVVGARISKTGNAIPQSGDLQGTVMPVSPGQKDIVQLTIDSVLP